VAYTPAANGCRTMLDCRDVNNHPHRSAIAGRRRRVLHGTRTRILRWRRNRPHSGDCDPLPPLRQRTHSNLSPRNAQARADAPSRDVCERLLTKARRQVSCETSRRWTFWCSITAIWTIETAVPLAIQRCNGDNHPYHCQPMRNWITAILIPFTSAAAQQTQKQ